MLNLLLQAFYLSLPVYFANMAPVLTRKKGKEYAPLDFGLTFREKRVFGKNKTIRGFLIGIAFAIAVAFLQYIFQTLGWFSTVRVLNYNNWLALGLLMGFGAMAGDSLKSFFKRQLDYKPGQSFFPFDQIDFIIGGLLMAMIIEKLPLNLMITAIVLAPALHIVTNHIGYYIRIRDEKW